jgi:hypothetical protein
VGGWLRWLTLAAVLFSLLASGFAAWEEGETYDEPDHLSYARRLLDEGETERESFLRFNSKTPALLPNVALRRLVRREFDVKDPDALRFVVRLPSLGWLLLLLGATFVLGRAAFGSPAAHVATLMAALDPNLIAHASVAGVDVAYACATLLTLHAGWRFAEQPNSRRALAVGGTLGLAFVVKFTAPLLVGGLCLLLVARRPAVTARGVTSLASRIALATAAAAAVICAAYLGHGVLQRIDTVNWKSEWVQSVVGGWPGLRLPLPIDFLTGLDTLIGSERGKSWNVVILGRLFPDGVWFYFLVLWLIKTPVAWLLAEVYGIGRGLVTRVLLQPLPLFLLLNLLLHLAYFSLIFRTQVGYRYALMCVPLGYVLAAGGLAPRLESKRELGLATLAVVSVLAENALYLGNPLSFTNGAVWPKREVFRLIADSNVDWGQNQDKIGRWIEERRLRTQLDPPHIVPGHNTLSLNLLAGVAAFERYEWVRAHLDPRGHFGHTYLWFDVSADDYERFLRQARTYAPREEDMRLCGGAGEGEPLRDGASLRVESSPAGTAEVWCLRARDETEVAVVARAGGLVLARAGLVARRAETVQAGQTLVYRLEPGVHALVALRERDFLGEWRVAGAAPTLERHRVAIDPRTSVPLPLLARPGPIPR